MFNSSDTYFIVGQHFFSFENISLIITVTVWLFSFVTTRGHGLLYFSFTE